MYGLDILANGWQIGSDLVHISDLRVLCSDHWHFIVKKLISLKCFSTNLEIAECPIAVIKRLTILGNIYILDDFPSRSIDIKVDSLRGRFA